MKLIKNSIVELLGTMFLVFFGCGIAITSSYYAIGGNGVVNVVATSLGFGLVLMALVYAIGHISGCHLNPAVSIACLIDKRMSVKEFLAYILAQIIGGILGAALLYGLLKAMNFDILSKIDGTNAIAGTKWQGYLGTVIFEIIITFFFVMVVLKMTRNKNNGKVVGMVIGLTLALVHLIGVNVTGTSVNPARSFGPALMALAFNLNKVAIMDVWVFFVGPLLGGALAGLIERLCKEKDEK